MASIHSNKFPFQKSISCHRFRVDKDCSSAEELTIRKDQFIELAQAALEQAKNEEKGVLQELIETFLKHTGAPMVADALIQQLKSQEVIEKLAENHYNQQKPAVTYPLILKEPDFKQTKEPKYQHSSNILIVSNYLWRLFRLLLLSSLVGLVYHFMCADPIYHQSLLI